MTTANSASNVTAESLLDQRLDIIEGALVGVIRRTDRLAIVSQIETLIREQAIPQSSIPAFGGVVRLAAKKRSRLAVSAGVLGIAALLLLFGTPVTYVVVGFAGEMLGEAFVLSVLGGHLAAVTLGGIAAIGLGIAALVSLKRRKEGLGGHGWAIAGLCTGPLAAFVGGLAIVFGGMELLESNHYSIQSVAALDDSTNPGMPPPAAYNADAGVAYDAGLPADGAWARRESVPPASSELPSQSEPQYLPHPRAAAEPPPPEAVPLPEPQSIAR